MQVKRIRSGYYLVTHNGVTYEVIENPHFSRSDIYRWTANKQGDPNPHPITTGRTFRDVKYRIQHYSHKWNV